MRRFRRSEVLIQAVGLVLTISATVLLSYHISLVKLFNLHSGPGDPFAASYYSEPVLLQSTPAPTAAPVLGESPKVGIFLMSPTNFSFIPWKTNLPVLFKFDVYPKTTECTFELYYRNEIISKTDLSASATSLRILSIPISSPGLYQWRVKSPEFTTELRSFTLRGGISKK